MFQHVEAYAGDPILSLNEAFGKDTRPNKINLSIGIYFDDNGKIPMLPSVRAAELKVVEAAGATGSLDLLQADSPPIAKLAAIMPNRRLLLDEVLICFFEIGVTVMIDPKNELIKS